MLLYKGLKVQETGYHILCAAFQPSKMGYIEIIPSIKPIRASSHDPPPPGRGKNTRSIIDKRCSGGC